MANQRIDQLNAETTPAAADLLPLYSIAGSDTKKITVKNLVQRGSALVDDASIPVAKVNLSGISGTNLAAGTVTASKLDTSTVPATGGVTVSSSNLQLVAPTSPIVRNASTGSLEHATSGATAGTYTKVTVDAKGHVTSGTTLVDADIPSPTTTAGTFTKITIDTKGRVTVGANLAAADVPFADTGVTAGTYTKLTVDAKGRVTAGTTLVDADVPALTNSGVAAGTYTKVTVDTKGRVTGGTTLTDADVPAFTNTGITAGTYTKLTVDVKGRATAGTTLAAADLPVATSSAVGGVSIPAAGGLALTGGGALSHSNAVAGGASTRSGITYDLQGHIVSTVAIVASDLPAATTAAKGAVIAGTGLAVDGNGILSTSVATTSNLGGVKIGSEFGLNGSNQLLLATQANVAGGTEYPKVTVNSKGVVTAGAALAASDIPNLDASKITTGSVDIARIAANAITGAKVANYAVTKIGDTQPTADHIGQFFFNPLSRDLFLWDGNVFQPIGISVGEIVFGGTFDASAGGGTGHVASVTSEGTAIGLVQGSPLPAAATANNRYYLVVSEAGTITSGNAPNVALSPPDIVLSTGLIWTEVDVSQTFTSVSASQVAFTPEGTITAANVQSAIEEVNNEKLGLAGGTITGTLEIGTTGSLSFEGSTANSFETSITAVDPTADRTITFPNISGTVITTGDSGTVTSTMLLDGTIVDADISATAEISVSKLVDGVARQLLQTDAAGTGVEWASNIDIPGTLDVTSAATFDSTVAVTGALTKSGSNVVTVADTGTVTSTMLLDGTILNADINASAAIVDTKLATIATALKVSNSATTATSANTASAIVARDASGNFTAGTITGTFSGTTFVGTTSLALNRSSANQGLTGISSVALPGATSGTVTVQPAAIAGTTTITLPATTGTVITTGDSGTVTSTMLLDGTILNADINASAAIDDTKLATIATAGKVSNSATTATNANTASAIVARDASGNFTAGTITAALAGTASGNLVSGGALGTPSSGTLTNCTFPTLNQSTTGNAATVTTNANLTGDITSVGNATAIASGVIVDADINASAAIADTKLATIATALKVSNSATTAASANTPSAIVARDASGNFTAGTITAALTGTASGNLVSGGALGTPSSGTLTNCTFPTLNQSTTGNAATVTTNANLTGDVTSVGNATAIASGVIVDADINASAAIAGSKINPNFGSQDITTTGNVILNNQGDLRLGDADGSHFIALQAASSYANNVTLTLPNSDGTNGQVLSTNGSGALSWVSTSGATGDVVGPASSTDNAITRFDLATGKLLQNSVVTISDTGVITAPSVGSVIPFYFADTSSFPSASTYHGAVAHSHSDGAMYFAHGGSWLRLAALGTAQSFTAAQRGTVSALGAVAAGTTTLDLATANNFSLSLPAGGTVTLANPSNQTAGQSGVVTITQNGTTAALVVYGGNWKFQSGAPSVSTTLSSVNVIAYYVESSSRITAQLLTNTIS